MCHAYLIFLDGRLLPKDTTVLILPYFMARDSTIWEKPLDFIPERFAGEKDNENSNAFSYISFSAGSRNCIGQVSAIEQCTICNEFF